MRILCILPDLNKCNGIASYIMNYYKRISHEKFKFDFLVIDNIIDNSYRELIESNFDNIIVFGKIRLNFITKIKRIKEIYKNKKYDAVYSNVLYTGFLFFYYAKKFKIKTRILHSHNTPTKKKNIKTFLYNCFSKLSVKFANKYFACSHESGKYLFKDKKFNVIANAIESKNFVYNEEIRKEYRKKLNLKNNFTIVHVGRFRIQKNHKFLIDVFEDIVSKNSNSKLLLVGDGPLENEIKEYVKLKKLSKKVIFMGCRDDINKILQAADIFIFPSFFEGLGIAIVEAETANLPCILSSAITKEAKFKDNVIFKSINSKEGWAEDALSYKEFNRNEYVDFKKIPYNIENEYKNLENKLIETIEGDFKVE